MNRKRSNRKPTARQNLASPPRPVTASKPLSSEPRSDGTAAPPGNGPSPAIRASLSAWLLCHLFAIAVSFTSVVEPSAIHAALSALVHPYLRPAHFAADDRPVYLTHGDPLEQPHRVQVTTASIESIDSIDEVRWRSAGPVGSPGFAVSDRVARWLSTAAMLAENDQPSLVAELLLPIVEHDVDVNAIRIVRLPTDLNDINAEVETPYLARVVRVADRVSLIQLNPARLSSQAVAGRAPRGDREDADNE